MWKKILDKVLEWEKRFWAEVRIVRPVRQPLPGQVIDKITEDELIELGWRMKLEPGYVKRLIKNCRHRNIAFELGGNWFQIVDETASNLILK